MIHILHNSEYSKFPIINSKNIEDLFSQSIFGPLHSYSCKCGKYRGIRTNNKIEKCPFCGTDLVSSFMRRCRCAVIELPIPVINPIFLDMLPNSIRTSILKAINRSETIIYDDTEFEPNYEGISELINYYITNEPSIISKIGSDYKDFIFLKYILVIPPEFRPMSKNKKEKMIDYMNQEYFKLMRYVKETDNIKEHIKLNYIKDNIFKELQKIVIDIYNYIMVRISKKTGLIRGNILGKRLDFSGRAVIAPNPELKLDECSLPYFLVLEILKPLIIKYLVNNKIYNSFYEAYNNIEQSLINKDYKFLDVVEKLLELQDIYCVLNRQPSLHRYSMLGFKVKVHCGYTIGLHPMLCYPFNADFDGDCMAVYMGISKEANDEIKNKLGILSNLISVSDFEFITRPSQDIVLGIYSLTSDNIPTIEYKGTLLSEGRYKFNKCLPDNYPVINEPIESKKLTNIMNDISKKYIPDCAKKTFDNIKDFGFEESLKKGYSLSLGDLWDDELIENVNNKLSDTNSMDENLKILQKDEELNEKIKKLPASIFIISGSRGSWDQFKQLVLARGYVADSSNRVRNFLIKNNFIEGLNKHEFFESCYGTRKGLLDTALSTSDSGYLTRQMIYATEFIEISDTIDDCGSTDYLKLNIDNNELGDKKIKSLLGRYYFDTHDNKLKIIDSNTFNIVKGTDILLRSPIYCKSEKICHTCYGNLYKLLHSPYIGIIASQAIGERNTQLVLRTFHISGAVQKFKKNKNADDNKENEDIINCLSLLSGVLHSPETIGNPEELVNILFEILSPFGNTHIVHYETIISSLMWSEQEKLWRLQPNRNEIQPTFISLLKVPAYYSKILGFLFSNPKKNLIKLIIESIKNNNVNSDSFISKLLFK